MMDMTTTIFLLLIAALAIALYGKKPLFPFVKKAEQPEKQENKMEITDDDVYYSMKKFYEYGSNGVDMIKHKSTQNYKNWGQKEYVRLAKRMPIYRLNDSHSEFFIKKDDYALALNSELEDYIHLETFKQHFKDIINYRTMSYYKERNLK